MSDEIRLQEDKGAASLCTLLQPSTPSNLELVQARAAKAVAAKAAVPWAQDSACNSDILRNVHIPQVALQAVELCGRIRKAWLVSPHP